MHEEIERLRAALRSQREWIKHWQADKVCNLAPTDGSLATALAEVDAVLGPVGHNSYARLERTVGASLS